MRKYLLLSLLGLSLSCAMSFRSWGQEVPPEKPNTHVQLVANSEGIQPGQTLKLGIHFQLPEGWHTYWLNPGDSGQAPQVRWSSNPPVRIAPLEFPYPEWIQGKSLVSFGYHDQVTFLTQAFLPPENPVGGNLVIQAQIKWLVCEETCIPQQKDLQLKLPIVNQPPLSNLSGAETIAEAEKKLPKTLVGSTFKSNPHQKRISLQIPLDKLPKDFPPQEAKFFPLEKGVLNYSGLEKSQVSNGALSLAFPTAPEFNSPLKKLPGVLVLGNQAFRLNPTRISGEIKWPWAYIGGGLILLAFLLLGLGYKKFNAR
jgi:DsbC/DsbD-like thiol-disulfide interchange protein